MAIRRITTKDGNALTVGKQQNASKELGRKKKQKERKKTKTTRIDRIRHFKIEP